MKILTVTAQKPDSTGSGVYLTELIHSFTKMGIENVLVCGIGREDTVKINETVTVYPVRFETDRLPFPVVGMSDLMPYKSTRYKDLTPLMQKQFEERFTEVIKDAVEKEDPDLILCHHLYFLTAIIRELFPDRLIAGVSHGSDLRQFQKNEMQRNRIKEGIHKLDLVFALHEEQKKQISLLFDMDLKKIHVIGTGYNSDIFHYEGYNKNSDAVRLIFAGKICEKKGIFCLLKAMDLVKTDKNLSLSIAGGYSDEEEYKKVRALADTVKRRVSFLGKLTQKELAEEFNKADIFVLPSFYEGLPLVIVEALSCGLKVVATNLPGVREWIDAKVPGNQIEFVEPPVMDNVDDASEESQDAFAVELARTLTEAVEKLDTFHMPDTSAISWNNVAENIVKNIEERK